MPSALKSLWSACPTTTRCSSRAATCDARGASGGSGAGGGSAGGESSALKAKGLSRRKVQAMRRFSRRLSSGTDAPCRAMQGGAGPQEAAHLFLHLVEGQSVLHVKGTHAAEARPVVRHELRRLDIADVDRELSVVDDGHLRERALGPPRADAHHLAVEGEPLGQLALRSSHRVQGRHRHRRSQALWRESRSNCGSVGTARLIGSCCCRPANCNRRGYRPLAKLPCSPGSWSRWA